jgi:serine protease AprX
MKIAPLEARGAVPSRRKMGRSAARTGTAFLLAVGMLWASVRLAGAAPYIWDDDGDHIDDRIETVHVLGYEFSFEAASVSARQRILVTAEQIGLVYSVYVVFDHAPTPADFAGLASLGMSVLHRYDALPAIRSAATFTQVQAVAAWPGVERVEAIPVLHPMLHDGAAAIGLRDASGQVSPTWESSGGGEGDGVVVAILDSGVNDEPDGGYPGHESLIGRCLGGASFVNGDSTLDTPRSGSVNPVDHGGALTQYHGTHVASIAIGDGGSSSFAIGVAPQARFIDVKVLNDAGVGTGVVEALDWCISNRARDWGGPSGFSGIDVINLSLSSVDASDGNDLASRMADRAAELGIVVVASVGNDGQSEHVPSPAGGDHVLVVGAFDHQRTPLVGDDRFANFNNYGPRAGDGDFDATDEAKPDLLAPGVAILAADGDVSTDGTQYKRLSGTSMSAAFVSGAAAALLSSHPGMSPSDVAEVLRATASRQLIAAPVGQGGVDPRWSSAIGYGALDLYAARLEMEQPDRTQIVRLDLSEVATHIDAVLRTQREYGPVTFTIERAPDVGGAPGAFVAYDAIAGTGDASLGDADNRHAYGRQWDVPAEEFGAAFWYRVAHEQNSVLYETPARRAVSPRGPSVATVEITIVHNAYDHDLVPQIEIGGISGMTIPVPASGAAISSEWVTGASSIGNVAWKFRVEVAPGEAEAFLPPNASHPWRLNVTEAGYLNRSGRITEFDVVWHSPEGDVVYGGQPLPAQTIEGHTTTVISPTGLVSVDELSAPRGATFAPNPVRAGAAVTFTTSAPTGGPLGIYDLGGRQIGHATLEPYGTTWKARWIARSANGDPLPPGVYFAGSGTKPRARLVVLE